MRVLLWLLILCGAPLSSTAEIQPGPWPPRGYACPRAPSAVSIDGRIDDAAWSAAVWTSDFVDIEGESKPLPRHRTRAKMLWDDAYFYFAAELIEPHLWATLRERDSVIYYDNDFEVFIDPDGDSHLYTEIELNALNTVWDLLLVKPYRDGGPAIHAWDIPDLLTAVHLEGTLNDPRDEDRGWTVEIAIPWTVLAETTESACPPASGDRWRVNFSRVQWHLEIRGDRYQKSVDPESGDPLPEDNWVWSPQREIAMHEPEHWGIVEFVDRPPSSPILASEVERVAWHLRFASYHLVQHREQLGSYPLTFTVPDPPEGAPARGPEWSAPVEYSSDGDRYTLTVTRADRLERITLHEDGRLVHRRRE